MEIVLKPKPTLIIPKLLKHVHTFIRHFMTAPHNEINTWMIQVKSQVLNFFVFDRHF